MDEWVNIAYPPSPKTSTSHDEMELQDLNQQTSVCPLCRSEVRPYYINFNEKMLMCENRECRFPFGEELDSVKVNKPAERCPICQSEIKFLFTNFYEKTAVCENVECVFPFKDKNTQLPCGITTNKERREAEDPTSICRICKSEVRMFFINLNEKIHMCDNVNCEYPFGHEVPHVIQLDDAEESNGPNHIYPDGDKFKTERHLFIFHTITCLCTLGIVNRTTVKRNRKKTFNKLSLSYRYAKYVYDKVVAVTTAVQHRLQSIFSDDLSVDFQY